MRRGCSLPRGSLSLPRRPPQALRVFLFSLAVSMEQTLVRESAGLSARLARAWIQAAGELQPFSF